MIYSVEFITFRNGQAEPVVVQTLDDRFSSVREADARAIVSFAAAQALGGAIGYRVVRNGVHVVTTRVQGMSIGA